MDGVSEGIENRRGVSVDFRIVSPDIRHGQGDQFREASRAIHSHSRGVRAKMTATCHAVSTAAADDVTFAGDKLARMKVVHVGSDGNDLADEFVPDGQRYFDGPSSPLVPIVDMHIGPADARSEDTNENVVDADSRLGDIAQPEAFFGAVFDESFHKVNCSRKRHALLSQEGSAARRVARGEVPESNLVGVRPWNLLSRDLDCVSIALSS